MTDPIELGYFAIPTPDPGRARAFWGGVFGWTFAEPDETGYLDIESTRLPGGIAPMPGDAVLGWFRTVDLDAIVDRVREHGGTATEPESFDFGRVAAGDDGNGTPFLLWEMAPGVFPPERKGDGHTANEPAYFVLSAEDPERAAAFLGPVLGWEFEPATHNGYRHVNNLALPGGIADLGEPGLRTWFRVDDIEASAERVILHGGTAGPREWSESGFNCDCEDDQGVRFSLWQPGPGL